MARFELNDEMLEQVAGGYVQYTYNPATGKGYCRINNDKLPQLKSVIYEFTDLDAFLKASDSDYQTYGDSGILPHLVELGVIRPSQG